MIDRTNGERGRVDDATPETDVGCLAAAWNSGKLANRGGCAAVLSQGRSRGSGCREEKGRKRSELADEPGRSIDKAREPGARKSKGSKRRMSREGGDGKEEEGRELT